MILPHGKNRDIITNFRFGAQVGAETKSGSHDFHFSAHFCNITGFQRGYYAALVCFLQTATLVGYNTDTLVKGKYNLISLPFAGVDGNNSTLAKAMSGSWNGGLDSDAGDQLQVWGYDDKGIGGYTIYYYYADPADPQWDGWYDASGSYYFDDCEENAMVSNPAGQHGIFLVVLQTRL